MAKINVIMALSVIIAFSFAPLLLAFEQNRTRTLMSIYFIVLFQTKGLQKNVRLFPISVSLYWKLILRILFIFSLPWVAASPSGSSPKTPESSTPTSPHSVMPSTLSISPPSYLLPTLPFPSLPPPHLGMPPSGLVQCTPILAFHTSSLESIGYSPFKRPPMERED